METNVVVERVPGALEGQIMPRHLLQREDAGFDRLIGGGEFAADHFRGINHDHVGGTRVRVNVEQGSQSDV